MFFFFRCRFYGIYNGKENKKLKWKGKKQKNDVWGAVLRVLGMGSQKEKYQSNVKIFCFSSYDFDFILPHIHNSISLIGLLEYF